MKFGTDTHIRCHAQPIEALKKIGHLSCKSAPDKAFVHAPNFISRDHRDNAHLSNRGIDTMPKRKARVNANSKAVFSGRYTSTCGMDTDRDLVVVAIFNAETGEATTKEFSQSKSGARAAVDWVKKSDVEICVIESTANYHLLFYDTFSKENLNIVVINPIVVKSLLRVEGKSDKADAMTLARLAAGFDLRTSNMPDEQMREIRNLFRWYDKEKSKSTAASNTLLGLLTGAGITAFRMAPIRSRSGQDMLAALLRGDTMEQVAAFYRGRKHNREEVLECLKPLPDYLHERLSYHLVDVKRLSTRIELLERQIMEFTDQFDLRKQIELMCTVPSVNEFLSLRVIGEMGQNYWERYSTHRAFAKAIGVAPSNEVSGGKILKRKASHGNKSVKAHFKNAVKGWLLHTSSDHVFKKWFDDYRRRSNYPRAVNALTRRFVESLWWVGFKGEQYKPVLKHLHTSVEK